MEVYSQGVRVQAGGWNIIKQESFQADRLKMLVRQSGLADIT